jgi:hypothetical protein
MYHLLKRRYLGHESEDGANVRSLSMAHLRQPAQEAAGEGAATSGDGSQSIAVFKKLCRSLRLFRFQERDPDSGEAGYQVCAGSIVYPFRLPRRSARSWLASRSHR